MESYTSVQVGVLAIQGAFAKHIEVLARIGAGVREVRQAADLEEIDGLVIPGGESTTMTRVMSAEGWLEQLAAFGQHRPVFGTCAGTVLMGTEVDDPRVVAFGWMPIRVLRNAYGSQVNSFRDVGTITGLDGPPDMEMVFIRAPKFEPLSDEVQVLGTCRGEPVMARYGHHLTSAFHPELTDDDRVHRFWLDIVRSARSGSLPEMPINKRTALEPGA